MQLKQSIIVLVFIYQSDSTVSVQAHTRNSLPAFELSLINSFSAESDPTWKMSENKRTIPSGLKNILDADVKLSKDFVEFVNSRYPSNALRGHLKNLEISCHGIPWLFLSIAGLYTSGAAFFLNLLFALILDIVVVAILKAFTRRRRPAYNVDDQFATVKMVDKFSFPSGHATRAVMIATILCFVQPLHLILRLPVIVWAALVSVSRIILGRHHVLDVAAGVVIGVLQGLLMGVFWRSEEQTKYLLSLTSDEDPWSSA